MLVSARCLVWGQFFCCALGRKSTVEEQTGWGNSAETATEVGRVLPSFLMSSGTAVFTGTWMMTGNGVMHNGTTILDEYGHNLDRLKVGECVYRRALAIGK